MDNFFSSDDTMKFTDIHGRPDNALLREYALMAIADGRPIFLVSINGCWVAQEDLDSERDIPAYYYIHQNGEIMYGPQAAGDALEKGMPGQVRPVRARPFRQGKYGVARLNKQG